MSQESIIRKAAWQTLSPWLSEKDRDEAIRVLQSQYLRTDTTTQISFISTVSERFNIPESSRKQLYYDYYNHLNNPGELPEEDPLVRLQIPSTPAPVLVVPSPPASVTKNSETPSKKATTKPKPQPVKIEPRIVVFSYLMQRLLHHYPGDTLPLFNEVIQKAPSQGLTISALRQLSSWMDSPQKYLWKESLDDASLSIIVHLFYIALCNQLGPTETDRLVHRMIADTDDLPEAREFSPRQLL